jgi:hypothetical protein
MGTTGMSELNAAVLAYLILDHDKTLSETQVMALAKRIIWATDEFGIGAKAALEYIIANPDYGIDL